MAEPTEKERELIKQFRERVKDDLVLDDTPLSDAFFLRWIRARNDLAASELMYRNSRKWREANNIDLVLSEEIATELNSKFQCWMDARDYEGRPVLCVPFGTFDVRKEVENGHRDELVRIVFQVLEICRFTLEEIWKHELPQRKWPLTQMTIIVDMKDYSMRQLTHKKTIEMVLEVMKAYEANYPESLGKAIVINAPWIFKTLFAMIKPLLSPATISKIEIYDSNQAQWKKAIAQVMDIDQLFTRFGGTRIMED